MTTTKDAKTPDGLTFNDDGTIDLAINGDVIHLRVPKFGEFRVIKKMTFDAQTRMKEFSEELDLPDVQVVDIGQLAMPAAAAGVGSEELESLVDKSLELVHEIVMKVVEMLGDSKLPEDVDDWPTWLVIGQNTLTSMMIHWRTVPLGRG